MNRVPVPPSSPGSRQLGEEGLVGRKRRPSLHHDVDPALPVEPARLEQHPISKGRFAAFCSLSPVVKWRASSTHTATTGVAWGRPSGRTVTSQESSAASNWRRVASQGVGSAEGSL